jgi:hypothetical protein
VGAIFRNIPEKCNTEDKLAAMTAVKRKSIVNADKEFMVVCV